MPPCPYGTKSKIQKLVMEDRMLAPVYTPSQNDVALEVGDVYRAKNYRIARVVTPQSHAVDYLLLNHIYYLRSSTQHVKVVRLFKNHFQGRLKLKKANTL